MKKMINMLMFRAVKLFGIYALLIPGTGFAYNLELTNISGDLNAGSYYTMDIIFNGDATDNVETWFAAVGWNTDIVTFSGLQYYDYNRDNGTPMTFDDYNLWNGEELPDHPVTDAGASEVSLIYNINGAENLDKPDEFYPVASGETLMATFYFTADVTGSYSDIASLIYAPQDDQLFMVNGVVILDEDTSIWKEGNSSFFAPSEYAPAPVPVPAAAWLLGAGLMGLAGLRRRNAA